MSLAIVPQESIGLAWVQTLRQVAESGGRAVNTLTTVTNPVEAEIPALRDVLDDVLYEHVRSKQKIQSVQTVASTIFPSTFYTDPGVTWTKGDDDAELALDRAANRLYLRYTRNYPLIRSVSSANRKGTYFGRMVAWENEGGSINQLRDRIASLRASQRKNIGTWNVNEISIAGEAEGDHDFFSPAGLQIHRPTDYVKPPQRGFPCLVHIDLTLFEHKLHMLAVYRHQQLITKGYGNLVGLGRLHRFLAQQTGFGLGELSMQAGLSDAEWNGAWGTRESKRILRLAEEAVA
jgi:hypothetical protein